MQRSIGILVRKLECYGRLYWRPTPICLQKETAEAPTMKASVPFPMWHTGNVSNPISILNKPLFFQLDASFRGYDHDWHATCCTKIGPSERLGRAVLAVARKYDMWIPSLACFTIC